MEGKVTPQEKGKEGEGVSVIQSESTTREEWEKNGKDDGNQRGLKHLSAHARDKGGRLYFHVRPEGMRSSESLRGEAASVYM